MHIKIDTELIDDEKQHSRWNCRLKRMGEKANMGEWRVEREEERGISRVQRRE